MSENRKLKQTISRILAVLLVCDMSLMISVALFQFGVYDQALLARSFEKSGYYEKPFDEAKYEILSAVEKAGLPDSVFNLSDLEMSFERRMRSQVLNRSDAAAELNSISLAKKILDWTKTQELDTTLRAEEGIIRLSEQLSQILYDKSEILGLEEWYEDADLFSKKTPVFMIILSLLFLICVIAIGFLQNRKYKFFIYVAASLAGASLIGVIQSGILFTSLQLEADGLMYQVMTVYRQELLFVGLKISAAVFVIAVMFDACGLAMKKMQ